MTSSVQSETAELWSLGLARAAELVNSGQVSALEVMDAVLARMEETEPVHHPYVYIDADSARAQAAASDERRAAGTGLSAIDGLPFGVKDVLRTQDLPTRGGRHSGSVYEAERVDDLVIAALRSTGAVIVGKLATHHFASGICLSEARNAVDPRYFGGGSTAGGGVSVALGSSFGAIGTDAGGSVRIPAAFNGVVGFIPTSGDMLAGDVYGETSISTAGIICRTVADIALAYPLIVPGHAQPQGRDLPEHDQERPLRGLRVGMISALLDGATAHITALVHDAAQRMVAAGAELVSGDVEGTDEVRELFDTIGSYERQTGGPAIIDVHRALNCTATLPKYVNALLVAADDYAAARERRQQVARSLQDFVRDNEIDVLLAPTTGTSPVLLEGMRVMEEVREQTKFSLFANLFGCPAISLPCGVEDTGIPVGLQLIGLPGADIRVLQWAGRVAPVIAAA